MLLLESEISKVFMVCISLVCKRVEMSAAIGVSIHEIEEKQRPTPEKYFWSCVLAQQWNDRMFCVGVENLHYQMFP